MFAPYVFCGEVQWGFKVFSGMACSSSYSWCLALRFRGLKRYLRVSAGKISFRHSETFVSSIESSLLFGEEVNVYSRLACPTYLVLYLREVNKLLDGTKGVYLPQINTFYLESALRRGEHP